MLKYKRTVPLILYFEGQMNLCPSDYLYFYATVLLKQYLRSIYAHLLLIICFISTLYIHFSLVSHNATINVYTATLKKIGPQREYLICKYFFIFTKTVQMYSLAILIKYFLERK